MSWDQQLYFFIFNLHGHNALLDQIMIQLAQDGLYLYGVFLVVLWFTGRGPANRLRNRETALSALIAGVLGLVVNIIISHIWFRPRPFVTLHTTPLISHSADASFPSDHTTGSTGLAAGAFLKDRKTGLFFGAFALLIGFSRVYVGVHYPTDVLGGYVIGVGSGLVVSWANRWVNPVISWVIRLWQSIVRSNIQPHS